MLTDAHLEKLASDALELYFPTAELAGQLNLIPLQKGSAKVRGASGSSASVKNPDTDCGRGAHLAPSITLPPPLLCGQQHWNAQVPGTHGKEEAEVRTFSKNLEAERTRTW